MPIVQTTRISPLDLQKNIAIGISLPFNGNFGPFNSTYSTAEQIKSNLINLLLTNKGERVFNPEFGSDLKRIIFEQALLEKDEEKEAFIQKVVVKSISTFIPEVTVQRIDITTSPDENSLSLTLSYNLKLSGNSDQITVEFI